jgi:thiol-disulfide isomerase/thioredoxin
VRYVLALPILSAIACGGNGPTPPPTTVEDFELQGYVDTDQDGLSFNDEPRAVRLSEYFASNRPGTKIIMLNAAAGWCSPCMSEAAAMNDFAGTYQPRGVAILTAVFQRQNGDPADAEFGKLWAENFQLAIPVVIDTPFVTSKYFDVSAMPTNMFVDAVTLEILTIATGAETGADPMREYRELLDFYLQ